MCLPKTTNRRANDHAERTLLPLESSSSSVSLRWNISADLVIDAGVGQKDFRRAALVHHCQHVRLNQFVDRLRGWDHGSVLFAPSLFGARDVIAIVRLQTKIHASSRMKALKVAVSAKSSIWFEARCRM